MGRRGQTHIETELAAGLTLLESFAETDPRAGQAVATIGELLRAPMPQNADTKLPRMTLGWESSLRSDGRGGRRTTEDYRLRAQHLGIPLPDGIGWAEARDAVRAWEIAQRTVADEYINIFMEARWSED